MGMKEEWREQGYSESEIGRLVEEAQNPLENEEEPGDLETVKKRISDAATGTSTELKGKVSEPKGVYEKQEESDSLQTREGRDNHPDPKIQEGFLEVVSRPTGRDNADSLQAGLKVETSSKPPR